MTAVVQRGLAATTARPGWRLENLQGRLVEVTGPAAVTLVMRLLHEAQGLGEPVAWVARQGEPLFFPPDAAANGLDLEALAVVRVPRTQGALAWAAAELVGSGGFGVVVLDVGESPDLPLPAQTRLLGLARKTGTAVVVLTERPGLGSLVSLRVAARRTERLGEGFVCSLEVLKDKRHGLGWGHLEVVRGVDGLC